MQKEKQHEPDLQPYEKIGRRSLQDIVFYNFIGGLAWALGATIGLSVIIWTLTVVAQNVNLVPIVGNFVSQVINFILATNPNLH